MAMQAIFDLSREQTSKAAVKEKDDEQQTALIDELREQISAATSVILDLKERERGVWANK